MAVRDTLVEALGSLGVTDVLVRDRGNAAFWLVALLNVRGRPVLHTRRQLQVAGTFPTHSCALARRTSLSRWMPSPRTRCATGLVHPMRLRCAMRPRLHPTSKYACLPITSNRRPSRQLCLAVTTISDGESKYIQTHQASSETRSRFRTVPTDSHYRCCRQVLADNITSLLCAAGAAQANLPVRSLECDSSCAATYIHCVLPRLVMCLGIVPAEIKHAIAQRFF